MVSTAWYSFGQCTLFYIRFLCDSTGFRAFLFCFSCSQVHSTFNDSLCSWCLGLWMYICRNGFGKGSFFRIECGGIVRHYNSQLFFMIFWFIYFRLILIFKVLGTPKSKGRPSILFDLVVAPFKRKFLICISIARSS